MKQSSLSLISIVTPAYNEEECLPYLFERLFSVLYQTGFPFEIIVVNDGSTDKTSSIIQGQAQKGVREVRHAVNQGQQKAILSGLAASKGEAVIVLDADLQDPPEYIPEILRVWHQGAELVICPRLTRDDRLLKKFFAFSYYRFLKIFDNSVTVDCGDYYLVQRNIVQKVLKTGREKPYLRGLLPTLAEKTGYVTIKRKGRFAGNTGYNLSKTINLALDGFLFSIKK